MSWGPWVECVGRGWPLGLPKIEGADYEVVYLEKRGKRKGPLNDEAPGLFWWVVAEPKWTIICREEAYMPILRIRIRRPEALTQLSALAADPQTVPIVAPEKVGPDA